MSQHRKKLIEVALPLDAINTTSARENPPAGATATPRRRICGGLGGPSWGRYRRCSFQREPDFGVTSVNYDFGELLARAEAPQ